MTIAITGASGFVGKALSRFLENNGHIVISLNRHDLHQGLVNKLEGITGVINLAGAPIIARWSESYKKELYNSRIETTKLLVNALAECAQKPQFFISTSAVGIYDNNATYDENPPHYGNDFLANLCQDWEKEALKAQNLGIRTAIFRFGIILDPSGGALAKMLPPFRAGLGGVIGNGKQHFSWIALNDLLRAFLWVAENSPSCGVYNLSAPTPTTNKGLTKALGNALHAPTLFPIPEFILRLIFSEGAKVLTDGQAAVPQKLLSEGFTFDYETIEETLITLLKSKP